MSDLYLQDQMPGGMPPAEDEEEAETPAAPDTSGGTDEEM